ncbi:MAG: hypothetical protein JO011_02550, partial [Ktedonobacteraceae bacterium]|nr:hypothetical protein [Ktedonobacteraceae bacterium]
SSTPGHAASSSPISNAGLQIQQLAPSTAAPASSAYSGQNNMFNGQTPQGTAASGNKTPSSSNSLNISPRFLISLLVILVIAITLILLISHHG